MDYQDDYSMGRVVQAINTLFAKAYPNIAVAVADVVEESYNGAISRAITDILAHYSVFESKECDIVYELSYLKIAYMQLVREGKIG